MPAFTPWTASQVTQQLVQAARAAIPQLTDFSVGSVLRGLYETYGITAQALAQQIVAASDETIQQSLQRALQIQPQPAQAAYGAVQFSVSTAPSSSVTLPQGFTVAVPNSTLQYLVGATTIWPAGQTTLDVVVTCTVTGAVGNVPANTITQIVSQVPSGLTGLTVTNLQAFTTGQDAQTLDDATAQIPAKLAALKAATHDAVAATALKATVVNSSGYVTEAVSRAVSQSGGYVPTPSVAPSLTAVSPSTATNLAAGTYTVGYTFTTADGETPLSPTAAVTLTAGQAITVAALTLPSVSGSPPTPNATGINYYLSTAAGSSTLAYVASGTGGSVTLTALPASGAASPPTVNTAFSVTPGFATGWIANDLNTAPSTTLIQNAQNLVTGYTDANGIPHPGAKAAGISTTVVAAQLLTQPVTVTILPGPGYTVAMLQDSVINAIQTYFAGLDIGEGIAYNTLIQAITAIPGVTDAQLTTPSGNVAARLGSLWTVGTITVGLMS